MAVMGRAIAKASVKRQHSHSKCGPEVALSEKKGKSCYCAVQSTGCADCQAAGKRSHEKEYGEAKEDTSLTVYALDNDEEKKWQERNARRRFQPGQSLCYNYYGARGSMRKR
ncbi:unnamed protein product [Calypogeia fissa]